MTCYGFKKGKCSTNIIGAHSIQNNGVLDRITYKNHLYNLEFDIKNNSQTLKFNKIGKNQASVFKGFCKYHDKEYFSIIEDDEYEATDEQNYWFAFRAFCFESHRKNRLSKHFSKVFRQYPEATRLIDMQINYKTCQLDLKDKQIEYQRFNKIYEDESYEELESFVKILPFKVRFTGTTAVAIPMDINGEKAADVYNYDEKIFIPSLYISVIPKEKTSLIIITRFKEDKCYETLLRSLRETTDTEVLYKWIVNTKLDENYKVCCLN